MGRKKAPEPVLEGLDKIKLRHPLTDNVRKLYQVPLEKLNCSFGVVTKSGGSNPLRHAVKAERRVLGADVTILFAIRRPGWANCREHGVQLSELAAADPRLAVVGAVKETGVADAELLKFYDLYFRHAIYKDDRWQVYKAMGGRTLSWPKLIAGSLRSEKRYKKKNIDNKKFGGDLHMQGGLLIFDKRGRLRYAYNEEYGYELDMEIVKEAIAEVRQSALEDKASSRASSVALSVYDEEEMDVISNATFTGSAEFAMDDRCPCDND